MMKNLYNKYIIFYFLLFTFAFSTLGCAKTVTLPYSFGDEMRVEVTLRGNFDVALNRYFLVLGSGPDLKVPLPPPDNITYEFIEPGTDPVQGNIADYYSLFYGTWAGYIVLEPGGYYLVKGPFVQGQPITREALANLGEASDKIVFSFRLGRIFDVVPDQIYFDFVSVDWPDGQVKLAADHLAATNPYISRFSGSILTINNIEDAGLDTSQDILRCDVEIQ